MGSCSGARGKMWGARSRGRVGGGFKMVKEYTFVRIEWLGVYAIDS